MKLRTDTTIPIWEHIFVIVGIFIFANAFRDIEFVNRYWNYLRILYYGFIAIVVALRLRDFVPTSIKATSVMLMTFIALLSLVWSEAPGATISRSVALIMMTIFSIYFAGRYPLGSQIRILATVFFLFTVFSVVFVIVLPEYGTAGSAWQGIFTQKNVFGRIMLIASIVTLAYPVKTPKGARRKLLAYLSLVVLIFLSDSMTSLIILFSVSIVFLFAPISRLKPIQSIAFFLAMFLPIMVTVYAVVNIDTDEVLIALGKDPTLTGRSEAWENLDLAIVDRPFTGYGYGAFFNQWNGTYGELFSEGGEWAPGSAHHNYRDIWLNIGVGGVILFMISNIILLVRSILLIRKTSSTGGMFPLMMMVFFIVVGFSESFALYTEVFWMLYLTLAFSLTDALEMPAKIKSESVPFTDGSTTTPRLAFNVD